MTNTVGTIRTGGTVAVVRGEEELVRRTSHLFAAATDIACAAIDLRTWSAARTESEAYDARIAELRDIAPQVLDLLGRGVKDEAAARTLGLGVRTYRRRVAELMEALGASSRFQAGVRARELGLV